MKTKTLFLTVIILTSFNAPVSAQNEPSHLDGLQSSLNPFIEWATKKYESAKQQYDEYIRKRMLFGNDIRMEMKAEFKGDELGRLPKFYSGGPDGSGSIFWSRTGDLKGTLYAEFDWQNMAEKMHLTSTKSYSEFGFLDEYFEKTIGGEDFYMFVDPMGYWYIPSGDLQGWGSDAEYLRVNPMGGMSNVVKMLEVGIEAAIDAKVDGWMLTEWIDLLMAETADYLTWNEMEDLESILPSEMYELLEEYQNQIINDVAHIDFFDTSKDVTENKLKSLLKELAKYQFGKINNLPPFIHFAFIISPTLARSSFNVSEETITSDGQVLATRMTVLSGEDAGYLIVFDQYGRLVHLRDTDGSTADYWYDKDVTVNIPPAAVINMDVLMQLSQPSMSDK